MRAIGRVISLSLLMLTIGRNLPATSASTAVPSGVPFLSHNLTWLSHYGAAAQAAAVEGTRAYLGLGSDLLVLEMGDPAAPNLRGRVAVPEVIRAVAVQDAVAALAAGTSGLRLVQAADPAHPVEVGAFVPGHPIIDVALAGNYVYALEQSRYDCARSRLWVIDISTPAQPAVAGQWEPGCVQHLRVQGAYAYLLGSDLQIVDLSTPGAPALTGRLALGWTTTQLAVRGTRVFAGYVNCLPPFDCTVGGVYLIDAANPSAPALAGTYRVEDSPPTGPFRAVAATADHIYLSYGRTLEVAQFSGPGAAERVARLDLGLTVRSLQVVGLRLYAAAGPAGLKVFDLSDPAHPSAASGYAEGAGLPAYTAAALSGSTLAAAGPEGLQLIDMANPAAPAPLGHLPALAPYAPVMVDASDLAMAGAAAYVSWGARVSYRQNCFGLSQIDLTTPAAPRLSAELGLGCTWQGAGAVGGSLAAAAAGQRVYVSDNYGLHVVDASVPGQLTEVGVLTYTAGIRDLAVLNGRAYLAAGADGLLAVDVTGPVTPTWLSATPLPGSAQAVAGEGQHLFVAAGEAGVYALSITNPAAPTVVGALPTRGSAYALALAAPWAFVLVEGGGVRVVDISDPARLVEVGAFRNGADFTDVAAMGRHIFVAQGENGVYALRLEGRLEGRVADGDGAPQPGVTVALDTGLVLTTDADGRFSSTTLPPGNYVITPTMAGQGFWPPARDLRLPAAFGRTIDFVLVPAPVPLTLTPGLTHTLAYTDSHGASATVSLPAGAITTTTALTLTPAVGIPLLGWRAVDLSFELAVSQGGLPQPGWVFAQPLTATLHYTEQTVSVISDEEQLSLLWWSGASWLPAAEGCPPSVVVRHPAANRLSVEICRAGWYTLYGPTRQQWLPYLMRHYNRERIP